MNGSGTMDADTDIDPLERGLRRLSVAECNRFWEGYAALRPGLRLARGNHWSPASRMNSSAMPAT